jgi:putative serine protease PepD
VTWERPTTILPGGAEVEPPAPIPIPLPSTAPELPTPVSTPERRQLPRFHVSRQGAVALLAVAGLVLAALNAYDARNLRTSVRDLQRTVAADERTQAQLSAQLGDATKQLQGLEPKVNQANASTIDSGAISAKVLKSVFTIQAGNALGTAFAVSRTSTGGTILLTNYHVVAGVWSHGAHSVTLKQGARSVSGQIKTVRPTQDLASIEVINELPLLAINVTLPAVGAPVLVVGSPLGLAGTVTTGVVSAHRSHLIQISAPISPGNSGGPVVDASGRAVGIASEKIVANNAEGLGFAIPIREVCSSLVHC